jgi:ABC-type glycerol-3-phosphate transport system permease component
MTILWRWLLNLLLVVSAVLMFIPFLWVVVTSILPSDLVFSLPPVWLPTRFDFSYYPAVFTLIPFAQQALNSLIVAGCVTVGGLTTSALAAYAFARLRFPGRDILFVAFLAALMVPQQVTVIPTFVLMRTLGLLDTLPSVILPGLINVLGIFLLRQFFAGIPRSLEEAAKLDGAGHLRILWQIILPLSGSALTALGIYIFQFYWNDFFWPNIFLKSAQNMTLPVGMVALQGLYGNAPVPAVFAAITMVLLPVLIVFVFMQRTLTESIALTGLRG